MDKVAPIVDVVDENVHMTLAAIMSRIEDLSIRILKKRALLYIRAEDGSMSRRRRDQFVLTLLLLKRNACRLRKPTRAVCMGIISKVHATLLPIDMREVTLTLKQYNALTRIAWGAEIERIRNVPETPIDIDEAESDASMYAPPTDTTS